MSSTIVHRFAHSPYRTPVLLCVVLAFATSLVYSGVAHHEFIRFDDAVYVAENVHVNTGLTSKNVVWAFTTFEQSNWHPVTWLSHMADSQFFGLNSGAHHLVNVFFHVANVLLLFLLLQKATGAVWRSFFAAALFAIHPMNVENVAWVAERKSLLSAFFSLLAMAAYGWYIRRPEVKRYVVIVLAYLLALLSKPMAVTLPLVLLILDYWPLARHTSLPFRQRWLRLSLEKLPLVLMSATSCAVTMIAQVSGGSVGNLSVVPLGLRLENAIVSYAAYLVKMFWPANQSVFYPFPEHLLPWPEVAASIVLMVGVTLAVWYLRRNQYLVMGWFLFVATLIPVIGIVQIGSQSMADRYAYLPYIGLFIMLAWGAKDVPDAFKFSPAAVAVAGGIFALALAIVATRYLQSWQNSTTLFTHASIVVREPNCGIEEGLADAALNAGKYDEAYRHAAEACALSPKFPVCHFNMAQILLSRNQLRDALGQYELAATYTRDKDMALTSLLYSGAISIELGDYDEADYVLASALKIDPTNSQALKLRQMAIDRLRNENR